MAIIDIVATSVTCNGTSDKQIAKNLNTVTDDKIKAFIHTFNGPAVNVSNSVYGLPVKFILAQWGWESGWDTGSTQITNQNWSWKLGQGY